MHGACTHGALCSYCMHMHLHLATVLQGVGGEIIGDIVTRPTLLTTCDTSCTTGESSAVKGRSIYGVLVGTIQMSAKASIRETISGSFPVVTQLIRFDK